MWSWDITKLRGPAKWSWYYLYVILDIFSRYVVGWMVASRESAALAEVLIRQTCAKQGIGRDQLTIHADRGSSMTSKPVAFLLADLGVTQSHRRPHVSDDNPFSEAQFKTLKYRPDFPDRFDSIEAARRHCQIFFGWYNNEHRHTGLGLHVPADVRTRNTYLAAHHAHIRGRRGLLKAIGATRHDLLIAYWHVVHDQVDYIDLGPDWAQRRRSTEQRTRRLVHQLEQLGHTVTLEPAG